MLMHPERKRLLESPARHRVCAAGRGSGKTEDAKRIILIGDKHHRGALNARPDIPNPTYIVAAPTREQVKSIWWDDLKALAPTELLARAPMETELALKFINGSMIRLVGLDKPQRIEGIAIDGLVVDEYAEVKPDAWGSSLEPACNRRGRPGWALFIGRPKGRNHFYDLFVNAKRWDGWDSFHWHSSEVMDPDIIEKLKDRGDDLIFAQEYEASFINFEGRVYYPFSIEDHARSIDYDPGLPLIFCFDFNVDPGVAAVIQEQGIPWVFPHCQLCGNDQQIETGEQCGSCGMACEPVKTTCVIGEVFIPRNSNTPAVCNRLAQDWKHHTGAVYLYGDATGGARKTSQTDGADWQLVRRYLEPHFRGGLNFRVGKSNPPERDRINAVNARIRSRSGIIRLLVDESRAPNVVKDFEGVTLLEGGSGEIDKKANPQLTHLSDAIGYYIHRAHPLAWRKTITEHAHA